MEIENGQCVDLGGFSATKCDDELAAVIGASGVGCAAVTQSSGSPGAERFSAAFNDVDVCNPKPPPCSIVGRLQRLNQEIPGVSCEQNEPGDEWFGPPVVLTCNNVASVNPNILVDPTQSSPVTPQDTDGCGCRVIQPRARSWGFLLGLGLMAAGALRWRRRAP